MTFPAPLIKLFAVFLATGGFDSSPIPFFEILSRFAGR